ncbi:MAG: RNA methyltransferase [Candidatus Omnitrophica bacterium]|nr:RNA methyltransferase [Candidatus Omnitrophota bacterium]
MRKNRPDITIVDNPEDTRISAYRSLKGKELEREGIFISEGEKVVQAMIDNHFGAVSCLAAREAIARYMPILNALKKTGAKVYLADNSVIEEIIGFRFHRGIMAIGRCPKKRSITGETKNTAGSSLFVALNSVNDPQNVGLIARNAAAFGIEALIVDNSTYDPYYRKAVRVSMGTIFGLKVFYEDDMLSSITWLKNKLGVRIVAASAAKSAKDIKGLEAKGAACIIFGNEDKGISSELLRISDDKIRIPISGDVDSLNVASASAIFLYEFSRKT